MFKQYGDSYPSDDTARLPHRRRDELPVIRRAVRILFPDSTTYDYIVRGIYPKIGEDVTPLPEARLTVARGIAAIFSNDRLSSLVTPMGIIVRHSLNSRVLTSVGEPEFIRDGGIALEKIAGSYTSGGDITREDVRGPYYQIVAVGGEYVQPAALTLVTDPSVVLEIARSTEQ